MHSEIFKISIPLLLAVGVSLCRHISYYDNESMKRPMISKSQERRICAELCMAGLGGEPCGESCEDVIPQGLPVSATDVQSAGGGADACRQSKVCPRTDACTVLCDNRLGYPLCNCKYENLRPFFKPNYMDICKYFCEKDYQLYGCGSCDFYKTLNTTSNIINGITKTKTLTYDWNSWCVEMCQEGEGGSACYCDFNPLG